MKTPALLVTAVCLLTLSARADDWPRFRGPNFDNASKEKGLLKEWPKEGPKLLWTYKDAGNGYAGPAIVGDTLYTMGARGNDEYLFALDLSKNPPVQKWAEKIGPTFTGGMPFNKGPSATPTVADGHVYALGGGGDLLCATTDGKVVWRKSLVKALKGEINTVQNKEGTLAWGYAGSPLVDGDKLVCVPGGPNGTVAALDAKKGDVIWQSKDLTESATYTSPVMATIGGVKQYVVMVQDGVAGISTGGGLLWRYKREEAYDEIQASTPVVKDDLVFMSGVKGGTELITVSAAAGKFKAKREGKAERKLESFIGGTALVDDIIYGSSGMGRAKWFAFDLKEKKVAWQQEDKAFPQGGVTAADGKLYLLDEKGDVGLAEASPKEWKLISYFTLPQESKMRPPSGRVWTIPVIADGKLYLRDQELIFCYQVK